MGWIRQTVKVAAIVLIAGLPSCGDGAEPVRLATEGAYHPFNFINDDGEIDGLERELGDELCRRAELECEWVLNDWEDMIPDLVAGEFDAIIAGMSITDERDMTIDFTEPYYPPTPSVYLALAGAGDEAVQGKLGAYANTIYSDYFTERGIAYVEFGSEDERIKALMNGDIDASLVDHAYAVEKLSEYEGQLTVVGPSVLLDRGIGIGVRNNNELLAKLNSAIASMKAGGSLDALIIKWVGENAATFGETSMVPGTPAPTATPVAVPTSTATPEPSPAPSPTPAPPSAQEMLDATTAAMKSVESGRGEVDIAVKLTQANETVDMAMRVAGEFQVPDRNQAHLSFTAGGITVEFEAITIGDKTFMTDFITGEWTSLPMLPTPFGNELLAAGAFGTDFGPEVAHGFVLVGEETLDGESVYRLRGPVPGEVLAEMLNDPSIGNGEGEVEYWIGVEDSLVRKVVIEMEVTEDDAITNTTVMMAMTAVTVLSDYNKPVDIQEPEVEAGNVFGEDDHGDYLEAATAMAVGESIQGNVDDDYDLDYFRFQAEEGQSYEIRVAHRTLEHSLLTLYNAAYGAETWSDDSGDPQESRITWWVAPSSDWYYVLVEGYGATGSYTLTVVPAEAASPTTTPTPELTPTSAPASAYSMQPHVLLRVVLVTEDWVPFSNPGGWTQAVPQKESATLRYYEAAIWEETDSVHLYAFPNDYDPLYGVSGGVSKDDVIAYREQYALNVHSGMPEESSDERSDFLRSAFEDFAAVLVERHPQAEYHFMFSGHGGPGGDLFATQMKNADADAFLASWTQHLDRPLGVIDMGGPCNKGGYEDLANFCKHAHYYVASDLPNGGYSMDEWTPEKHWETSEAKQYHRILASNDTLEKALIERVNLRRTHYEYSKENQTRDRVAQANYVYSCVAFRDFSAAFEAFLDETAIAYPTYDLYTLLEGYSAPSSLLTKFQNVIVHAVDNRDFFVGTGWNWNSNIPANGIMSPLERIYQRSSSQ